MRHIDRVLPEGPLAELPNYRPLLHARLKNVLGIFAVDAMRSPHLWYDAPPFLRLLNRINGASPVRRERFFDDLDIAAWLSGGGVDFTKPRTESSLGELIRLVERMEGDELVTGRSGEEDDRRIALSDHGREPAFDVIDLGDRGDALPNIGAQLRQWFGPASTDKRSAPVPQPTTEAVVEHLRRHLIAVHTVWPAMGALADRHIKAVLLVPGSSSGSMPALPGTVFFSYANIWRCDGGNLVHETIHQVLYCLAAERCFIADSAQFDYVSEWTGNVRNRKLYLHIPVVYYAMAEYWYRTLQAGIGDVARHRLRIHEICRGLDLFFERRVGHGWLTADGRELHRQLKERYDSIREVWFE